MEAVTLSNTFLLALTAVRAFGDGLASGFMMGEIMVGASMAASSAFRFATSHGVPSGSPINFRFGRRTYPDKFNSSGGGTI